MKLETFFEKFDQFADAPDAVAKMRELVRNLAVIGKLVRQDPKEVPAGETLARIADDSSKAVRAKRMRNSRPIPVYEDEFPFNLPVGWAWAPLGALTAAEDGAMCDGPFGSKLKTEHYISTNGYSVLRLGNIGVGYFIHGKEGHISREHFESLPSNHTAPGDLLVAGLADPLVRCCEIPPDIGPAVNKSDCFRVRLSKRMDRSYVRHYLNSRVARAFAAEENHGMTRERINLANAKALPVAVPPLAEQKRIVAKVDELMALCDRLETQQQEREARHAALARASLARFADAPTPANLPFLFHPSYAIPPADLRKSILTLAVQGKLTPQDPNDEPAGELLAKIQTRRAELQSASRIPKPDSQFSKHDGCEETLPYSWKQVRIGDLCLSIVPQRDKPLSFTGDIPWVTLPVFKENSVSLALGTDCKRLSLEEVEKYRLRMVPAGSVLMSCIGRFGLVALLDLDVVPNQQIHGFYFPTELLEGRFLCYSIMAQKTFLEAQSTTTTIAYLNKTKCESVPIALPPLAEQRRIVAKVEQLMALVDQLETQLAASRATAANLLSALVAELTGTTHTGKVAVPHTTSSGSRGRPRKSP